VSKWTAGIAAKWLRRKCAPTDIFSDNANLGEAGMNKVLRSGIGASALLLFAATVQAQQPTANFGCKDPLHRQFDFWIGEWDVTTPAGQLAGKSSIKMIEDGCAILENWTGSGGGTGTSINYVTAGGWHQLWVSNGSTASVLKLSGALDGKAMVMTGEHVRPDGKRVQARMRWEPIDGGRVRQTWENSQDGGTTWTTSFAGIYTRASRSSR
jgi:hypothetical protein